MRKNKDNIKIHWNQVELKNIPSTLLLDDRMKTIPKGATILDIGCGNCEDLRNLSQNGYLNLYGIDINQSLIDSINLSAHCNINVSLKDATRIDLPDNFFDCAIMKALLTVLVLDSDINQSLSEAFRVLKPNGVLLIEDFFQNWHIELYRNRYLKYSKELGVECSFPVFDITGNLKYYARHFNVSDLSTMLLKIGFNIEDISFKEVTTQSGNKIIGFTLIAKK